MNPELAAEIHKHLLEAAEALRRAECAGQRLPTKHAREVFMEPLSRVTTPLHFELLRTLYDEHPELRPPPRDPPSIDSTLRWEDVSLPDSISEEDIDAAIFTKLTPRLQKMAKVISDICERCKVQAKPVNDEIIAARIIALAEAGRIEGAGDLRMWRHSEVRLRP